MKKTNIKLINGENAVIIDTDKIKILKSENYNFLFNKDDGFFCRWGKTQEDDGDLSVARAEIADIEISTACKQGCEFCYKGNTSKGDNMSLETFKKVLSKINEDNIIGQIAFGITDIDANPEMWNIFDYTRSQNIIPNVTINGSRMTSELYDRLAKTMGAVAVSVGPGYNKNNSYNSVKELTDRGLKQVNIHHVIYMENFDYTISLIKDIKTDKRLKNLKALVFLSLKTKGRAKDKFTQLTQEKFNEICDITSKENISIGFDSCSSHKYLHYIDSNTKLNNNEKEQIKQSVEMCESGHYSLYIDVFGRYSPCSFTPDTEGWENGGIDVINCNNFVDDVWYNERTNKFRDKLIKCGRDCPLYKI